MKILIVRCSPVDHVRVMLAELSRRKYAGSGVYWLMLGRPGDAAHFSEYVSAGRGDFLAYDRGPAMTDQGLSGQFLDSLTRERIDVVYVPFNREDESGYEEIFRFVDRLGASEVNAYTQDGRFERSGLADYLARQRRRKISGAVDKALFVAFGVPWVCILLAAQPVVRLFRWLNYKRSARVRS